MRIVAFDPGKTTGFAEAVVSDDGTIQEVKTYILEWERRFAVYALLYGILKEAPLPDTVVVEAFRLYEHRMKSQVGSDFPSVQVIGIIETYCFEMGILERIVYQPASVLSRVTIPDAFKEQIQKSAHARDAFRHLRYYVVMRKGK